MKYLIVFIFLLISCNKQDPDSNQKVNPTVLKRDMLVAITNDNLSDLKALVSRGANVNERYFINDNDFTPLLAAIALNRESIALYLLERGADLYPRYQGYSAFDFSLFRDENSKVSQEIKFKVSLSSQGGVR